MSLQEIIESFRTGLMLTGLWVLAAIVAGCIGVWLYRSAQGTTALLRRLRTWIDGVVFTLLFTACVLIGGTKTKMFLCGLGTASEIPSEQQLAEIRLQRSGAEMRVKAMLMA